MPDIYNPRKECLYFITGRFFYKRKVAGAMLVREVSILTNRGKMFLLLEGLDELISASDKKSYPITYLILYFPHNSNNFVQTSQGVVL